MLILYKGDDTDFADLGEFVINIDTQLDLTGFTGKFVFMDVVRDFTKEEIESRQVHFCYTAAETEEFCIGRGIGTFHLFDKEGRHAAVRKVMVEVVPHCRRAEGDEFTIQIDNVYDYEKLGNIPTINGVQVVGDLDSEDLGIGESPKSVRYTEQELTDAQKSQARSNIGAAESTHTHTKSQISDFPSIPTKTSDLSNNGEGVEGKPFLTSHQDISGKQDKLADDGSDLPGGPYLKLEADNYGDSTAVTIGCRSNYSTAGQHSILVGGGSASGTSSVSFGQNNKASGNHSFVNGTACTSSGSASHSEGMNTNSSGDASHSEGYGTKSTGSCSHAEGYETTSSGDWSHAEGESTVSAADNSHVEGVKSKTLSGHDYAFVYNGDSRISGTYDSHGKGTFSINPRPASGSTDPATGFYIGETSLKDMLDAKADSDQIKTVVTTISSESTDSVVPSAKAVNDFVEGKSFLRTESDPVFNNWKSGSSMSAGYNAESPGEYSVSIGNNAKAKKGYSVAFGPSSTSDAFGAFQLGSGTNSVEKSLQFRGANLFVETSGSQSGAVASLGSGFPKASDTVLGAVKIGSGISVSDDGTISANTGSSDYSELSNKPKINGVELSGSKTLSEIGAASASSTESALCARCSISDAGGGKWRISDVTLDTTRQEVKFGTIS